MVSNQRHSGRHSHRSMHAIGCTEAQGKQKCRPDLGIEFRRTQLLHGDLWLTSVYPFYNHGNACVSLLSHLSDQPPRRPLRDCFEHIQNLMVTMASMAIIEHSLYHLWMTKATMLPALSLQQWPGQFCGRTREAQKSQAMCKGGLSH